MTFFVIAFAMVYSLQAAQVAESAARQIAYKFFSEKSSRFTARPGQSAVRLAYTAECNRFYVYDRGSSGGFVIVAGDDRLPQVLGYGAEGDFSSSALPTAVQYWMEFLERQISFLQSHGDVAVHHPAHRASAVGPLLTSHWDQSEPYNNFCPTYGAGTRAVTGCVATATAQVMNYHQWPPVGRGNHSYYCYLNNNYSIDPIELSADFSQSVYRWDLMLDTYDESSSEESCDAVARLMSDVGISMDMSYGSNSGASEANALMALKRYFGYSGKGYLLNRDQYGATEWDQYLVDEISKGRPVLYSGKQDNRHSGHEFVLDGFDSDGYYHVNWGWSGRYDGYFLVSLLEPASYNFNAFQTGIFGLVPETQADVVDDVMHVHGLLFPNSSTAPLGTAISLSSMIFAEGNMMDTLGYEENEYGYQLYYTQIPLKMNLHDKDGLELNSVDFSVHYYFDTYEMTSVADVFIDLPQSLEDGEYFFKMSSPLGSSENYENIVKDYSSGKELYVKMNVCNDTAYFRDSFLYHTYGVKSFTVEPGVKINETFNVGVTLDYLVPGLAEGVQEEGPFGKAYLSLMKDGVEVAASPMCEVQLTSNSEKTYVMQLTAPSETGAYQLVLNDEAGNRIVKNNGYINTLVDFYATVHVLPPCQELVEDFETMAANNSTSDKDVQGRFTTWSFNKSGVRAPGTGKCNGTNAVMMKKPSTIYSTQPVAHNFFLAQATFFNPTSTTSKYKLEYSLDGGTSWQMAYTIEGLDVVEVPDKQQLIANWNLDLTASQPATFRISMIGGGNAATYVDDIALYYIDIVGDVNGDGEVNIADINAIIDIILSGKVGTAAADVNEDGEVNIADINTVIDVIQR